MIPRSLHVAQHIVEHVREAGQCRLRSWKAKQALPPFYNERGTLTQLAEQVSGGVGLRGEVELQALADRRDDLVG